MGQADYKVRPFHLLCGIFLFTLIFSGCTDQNSAEEEIRDFIGNAELAIEESNIRKVKSLVSDNYNDDNGRTKKELIQYVTYQVLRKQSIHLYTSIQSISFPTPKTASVQIIVAMTGAPADSKNALMDLRADIYTFDCNLVEQDSTWVLMSASWQPAMLDDLFPE